MKKEIKIGYTNQSFKENDWFFQYKKYNGLNHKSDYKQLKQFEFVPKLIEDNNEFSKWEWIDGQMLINPTNEDIVNLAKIVKRIHNSNVVFYKSNVRRRIDTYRKIMNKKNIKIDIVEKLFKKINNILKNMDRTTPVHGDIYKSNVLKDKNNRLFIIDWEYSHMGDKHYELAYIIEGFGFNKEQEKIFLNEYSDYDEFILKKHKVLVNYLTILWLYSNDELFFSPDECIKKLKTLDKEGF